MGQGGEGSGHRPELTGSGASAEKEIVLVGAGHAHVHVLNALWRADLPGARVSLVTPDATTFYSGMIPGVVAGLYSASEAQLDVARLCGRTGTRLLRARAIGVDRKGRTLLTSEGASIPFDILSFDVGAASDIGAIEGAADHAIAVKPLAGFFAGLAKLRDRCRAPGGPRRIAMIGGGAAGVELILALRARLRADAVGNGRNPHAFKYALVSAGPIMETFSRSARRAALDALAAKRVRISEGRNVVAVDAKELRLDDGSVIEADAAILATGSAAPSWFAGTGLALDKSGFLAVGPTLQSTVDPDIFGAGDCVAMVSSPREKSGVFAVRAGPPLADNILRRATGVTPRPWRPQRSSLSIITLGERRAIATRGPFTVQGEWVWRWKDRIDGKWMADYT